VTGPAGRPVVVVTGGGAGIGAAVAEHLGRDGWYVVTLDPMVSLDGAERLPEPTETTAGRIVAAGGAARASSASVTDRAAVQDTFEELVRELGRLDAVVNVAGISRPTGFAAGTVEDWRALLDVHLAGYCNVLAAALPLMAEAGRGRILGVTSGSGWRPADAGAYSCAKRAVAALTWQLGRHAPPGVTVNAMSPIAVTRMVTAALSRAAAGGSATGGLSLGSMPAPEQLGPLAAYLVSDEADWCSGQVLFAGGPELAVVRPPQLLEVVGLEGPSAHRLEAVTGALVAAEARQASGGGGNSRFAGSPDDLPPATVRSCGVVTDRPELLAAFRAELALRGVDCHPVPPTGSLDGAVDAVVVALSGAGTGAAQGWQGVLREHEGLATQIEADARWARAVADQAATAERSVRLVTLTDAATSGGRSRAQASAQLARAARGATDEQVSAYAVAVEDPVPARQLAELAVHLVCSASAAGLAGAELAVGAGWLGLRSHPRPGTSIALPSAELPGWFGPRLRQIIEEAG
jgi:NAD(P)-dependent dehydrogenase (short-subunit alcohol dehydrogenase family)